LFDWNKTAFARQARKIELKLNPEDMDQVPWGVISNPLGLGHPLPLSFSLPDVEELWTATLQFLLATWPIKRSVLYH
jgi:hypothetical protein